MHPEKPSRRTLLGGCLACLLGWFGQGRQPAQAVPPSPQPPAEESKTSPVLEFRTSYDAEGRCIRREELQHRAGAAPVWVPISPSQVTPYKYPS